MSLSSGNYFFHRTLLFFVDIFIFLAHTPCGCTGPTGYFFFYRSDRLLRLLLLLSPRTFHLSVKRDLISVKRDLISVKRDPVSVKRDIFSVKRDSCCCHPLGRYLHRTLVMGRCYVSQDIIHVSDRTLLCFAGYYIYVSFT